jgi:MoaA/NifB/PqqE/SkfB family radical SAM enzyme/pimeloyl-ACP methyl ester carboxylesterase
MARLAALLVHGFSGSPGDLAPLAAALTGRCEVAVVESLVLPGHGEGNIPERFDRDRLTAAVAEALVRLRREYDSLLVVGHSTGGSLTLAALAQTGVVPELTVLAAVPYGIDLAYLERWQQHRAGQPAMDLATVAAMVVTINASGCRGPAPAGPVLLLQGEDDPLVVKAEAQRWQRKLPGEPPPVFVPAAGHQLFTDSALAVATVVQAADNLLAAAVERRRQTGRELLAAEPEAALFLADRADRLAALADAPSGRRLCRLPPELPEFVPWSPVFANIEITTRCNLACRYCARAFAPPQAREMAAADFAGLLEKLPAAYRITLVGLGEPLLHPQVATLVALAKAAERRVGLVTNAQLLDEAMSRALLDAGLDSIAFSLDTIDAGTVQELRAGSDLARIVANIRTFNTLAETVGRPVARAVFTAVSRASLPGLERLIEKVATLGVHVLMLSDLNFAANCQQGLSGQIDAELETTVRRAVSRGFALNLPVLGVRALEDFGLADHYRDGLLLPVQQLYRRAPHHAHCFSPWQTVPVNVAGEVTLCDCQPDRVIGNLRETPLDAIWNGMAMRAHRRRLRAGAAPSACRDCPRY